MKPTVIHIADIREGDRFVHEGVTYWTALDSPTSHPTAPYLLTVRFADGGQGERVWDDNVEISVIRAQ